MLQLDEVPESRSKGIFECLGKANHVEISDRSVTMLSL